MTDLHPDDQLIDRYLNGRLTADENTAFEIRLLDEPALLERVQLVETMKQGLQQHSDALKTAPEAVVLSFRSWIRQPQSLAASLLVVALMWPALRPLLVTDSAPALGIASVLLLETNRGDAAASFSGPAPYLLQIDAGLGNNAGSFTVTLQAEGGNRLLLGQGLRADADGWVRVVIPTSLSGNYQAELLWADAAGATQRRQFSFGVDPGTPP